MVKLNLHVLQWIYSVQWRRQLDKWGDIFIYSCSAQLISFEIESISKEINCAEHEYMNMSPSLIELATPLTVCPKKGYILKSTASAERSNLDALTPK